MSGMDEYLERVRARIPRCMPDVERIEADLRIHVADRVEAGDTEDEALAHLGSPEDVAREFLAQHELRPAPLGRRVGAFLIDIGLGAVALLPVFLTLWFWVMRPPDPEVASDMLLIALIGLVTIGAPMVLAVVYFPVAEAIWGQTIGKHVLGLCVVKEDGERVGWVAPSCGGFRGTSSSSGWMRSSRSSRSAASAPSTSRRRRW